MQHLQEDGSYNQLYPKTDSYPKNETLTNNTSQMFRIENGTPEDVMQYLGKYAQYWWRRTKPKTIYSVTIEATARDAVFAQGGQTNTVQYSNQVYADSAGVHLMSPTSLTITGNKAGGDTAQVLYQKYVTNCVGNSSDVLYVNPLDGIYWYVNMYYVGASGGAYLCRAKSSQVAGDWEYLHSNNRNAYPDSGNQSGYTYEFLGIPFDNAVALTKSYTRL